MARLEVLEEKKGPRENNWTGEMGNNFAHLYVRWFDSLS